MSLYAAVCDLPLVVESYTLDGLSREVRPEFTRRTTVVQIHGAG
jgi:hypothetical protein